MTASQEIDKYTHLLQPIRDLAANWNINIANELGEYLEVLEGITFSFQKGQSLNFAEAALVIQGSACVYSKKVEYLHSLVYQALEFVADRKVKSLKSKGKADAGIQDDDEFDDEEHFLSLDDTLEEGTGIDLEEDAQLEEALPVRLPATLLALEDTGLGDGDGEAGNYRIASCAVHHSGALLLEARDGFMLDEFLRPIANGVAATQMPNAFPQGLPLAAAARPTGAEETEQQPYSMPQDDDFDDGGAMGDYFGGGGDDFQMDDAAPMPDESQTAAALAEAAEVPDQQEIAIDEEEEEEFDPYEPLDPSDTGSMPSKPFKKYSRLPTKPKMRAAQQQQAAHALTDGLLLLPAPATGLLFPEFNYALHHSQLEDAREARKLSREVAAAKQKQKSSSTATAVFTMQEAEIALAAAADEDEDNMNDDAGFDPGFFDDQIDAGMPDDTDFDGAFGEAAEAAAGGGGWGFADGSGPLTDAFNENGEISYEDLCRAHVESLISAAAAAEVQTELASRVSTWRTKMAPVLEEEDSRPEFDIHYYGERILQGLAQLSVSDTITSTQEEDQGVENPAPSRKDRNKSSKDTAKNKNTDATLAPALTGPVEFNQVVIGSQLEYDYDVPRAFSSMLQLVNNGNLRITKINDSSDDFRISLLSTELKHKRIDAYLAPSAAAEAEGEETNDIETQPDEEPREVKVGTAAADKKPTSKRRKA